MFSMLISKWIFIYLFVCVKGWMNELMNELNLNNLKWKLNSIKCRVVY